MVKATTTRRLLGLAAVLLAICGRAEAAAATYSGTLADGAAWLIEVPDGWNGTLLLYSHGYTSPGSPNPARNVGDPLTRAALLSQGFAIAGSSYATTGWAIHEALPDQIAVLDAFEGLVGKASRTIAWGHSLGGIITAGLIQRYPHRFDAALPMCGVLAGGVGTWNQALDAAFAFANLAAPGSGVELVHITNPGVNLATAVGALAAAQATAQGRARLALAAALADTPGWFDPTSPEPAESDIVAREANQYLWMRYVNFPFIFALRAELEFRAGGNPSWNTGVDYRRQLRRSANRDQVAAAYQDAGLDLEADLEALEHAPRISADPAAVSYLASNIVFDGRIRVPVLTLHTDGDGLVNVQQESAYRHAVDEAGRGELLRQVYVHRAGHCTFTPAETVAALGALLERLDARHWHGLRPDDLNARAAALGPGMNVITSGSTVVPTPPAYVPYHPARFLRPFDAVREHRRGDACRVEREEARD
jgi:dienelactone hydrolase